MSLVRGNICLRIWRTDIDGEMVLGGSRDLNYFLCSALVGMSMYKAEAQTIAKPTELLNSIKAYLSVFQNIERYGKFCGFIILFLTVSHSPAGSNSHFQRRAVATNAACGFARRRNSNRAVHFLVPRLHAAASVYGPYRVLAQTAVVYQPPH